MAIFLTKPIPPKKNLETKLFGWSVRSRLVRLARFGWVVCAVGSFGLLPTFAAEAEQVVAVFSGTSPDYHRAIQPGGKFAEESFAFGEGGDLGGTVNDYTIDRLRFVDIARRIAPALTAANYRPFPSGSPGMPHLLIMVYWGTTTATDGTSSSPEYQIANAFMPPPVPPMPPPPNGQGDSGMVSDPSTSGRASEGAVRAALQAASDSAAQQSMMFMGMANRRRDRQNQANAAILGYLPELSRVGQFEAGAMRQRREAVLEEVGEARYYVVLLAYDFKVLQQERRQKLLWETRFSLRQHGNSFDERLAAMAQLASRYFGAESHGLTRRPMGNEHVDFGEMNILGIEPDPK